MNDMNLVRYDGGHIVVDNLPESSNWYSQHMRLSLAWQSDEEGQALMRFPERYAIALIASSGGTQTNLNNATVNQRVGAVRLCFACPDLIRTHGELLAEGVRVDAISPGPDGIPSFDFYDGEGTRLTAVAHPGQMPADARFTGYAAPRISVKAIEPAINWYTRYAGMTLLEHRSRDGVAHLALGDFESVWLETRPENVEDGLTNLYARPYFYTSDIQKSHDATQELGFNPSSIQGSVGSLQVFYCYDQDGNPVYIWTYPNS